MKQLARLSQLEESDLKTLQPDFDEMVALADRITGLAEGEVAVADAVSLTDLREDIPPQIKANVSLPRTVIPRMKGV